MYKTQCLLAFVALYVGLAHSWEIAVSVEDRLEFDISDTKTDAVRLDSQNPSALAYDEVHDMLLYVDKQSGNDAICGYNISFAEYKCYMKRSGRDIQGLAYDPITQYLFFTDTKERSINWISLQSGYKNNVNGNLLIKLNEGIPTDIAIDSCRGHIYWINTNLVRSTIERARFDGSYRKVVIESTTRYEDLHSLTIGQQTKQIYWFMPRVAFLDDKYRWINELYSADLNGESKQLHINFTLHDRYINRLSISKNNLFVIDWCSNCGSENVWKYAMTSKTMKHRSLYRQLVNAERGVGIVANNKIAKEFEGIQECQYLIRLVPHNALKIAREYEGPFCVHGVKVKGQSLCKCTPGYTGERCDVSVCENYCMHGNCSFNGEGLPECRCNAGYSGARCEVHSCLGYCSNNGTCSLNADSEPVCTCIDDYAGDRCEVADCLNYCFQGKCSLNCKGLPECSCNAGYSGARCEVHSCLGYCSNNGTCSLNADSEPVCTCIDDYAGDRCEVADCLNYCFQGKCRLNCKGLPECRCNAGYTGARCEVNSCLGYCLNNGSCSMNELSEPFCHCLDDYAGDRCELNNANSFLNEVDGPACQCSKEDKNGTLLTTPIPPTQHIATLP